MSQNPVLAVTTYRNVKDAQGIQDYLEWSALTVLLKHHTAYRRKEEGLLWSPTDYHGVENGRTHRKAAAVRHLSALVIDIDDGTLFSGLPSALKTYEFIAHTTWQHRSGHHRYRIILPLRCVVDANDWKDFFMAAAGPLSGFHADTQCSDPCRIYYYPQHPLGGAGFSRHNEGVLLDANDFYLEMVRLREERLQKQQYRCEFPEGGT